MKALRYYGKKDLRLEDIDIPAVKENQVKVNTMNTPFQYLF